MPPPPMLRAWVHIQRFSSTYGPRNISSYGADFDNQIKESFSIRQLLDVTDVIRKGQSAQLSPGGQHKERRFMEV